MGENPQREKGLLRRTAGPGEMARHTAAGAQTVIRPHYPQNVQVRAYNGAVVESSVVVAETRPRRTRPQFTGGNCRTRAQGEPGVFY